MLSMSALFTYLDIFSIKIKSHSKKLCSLPNRDRGQFQLQSPDVQWDFDSVCVCACLGLLIKTDNKLSDGQSFHDLY